MVLAGETRSDARMASEGPRATGGENPYEKIKKTSRPGELSYPRRTPLPNASKYETPSVA